MWNKLTKIAFEVIKTLVQVGALMIMEAVTDIATKTFEGAKVKANDFITNGGLENATKNALKGDFEAPTVNADKALDFGGECYDAGNKEQVNSTVSDLAWAAAGLIGTLAIDYTLTSVMGYANGDTEVIA